MRYQLTIDGQSRYLEPHESFTDEYGTNHSSAVLRLWTDEELAKIGVVLVEVPDPLPTEVPMYKVRKLLIQQGLLGAVQSHLDAIPGINKELALVDWEYAPNLVVNSPLALGAKAALGLTDEQYEAMVLAAARMP